MGVFVCGGLRPKKTPGAFEARVNPIGGRGWRGIHSQGAGRNIEVASCHSPSRLGLHVELGLTRFGFGVCVCIVVGGESESGTRFVSGGADGRLRVWRPAPQEDAGRV